MTNHLWLVSSKLVPCQTCKLISALNVIQKYPANVHFSALECMSILAPCWRHITFGCSALDQITGGGLPIRGLTEISGESGCGKSQICLQLSLSVQLPTSCGGLEKSVVYICTEDAFPLRRLHQLASLYQKRYGIKDWMDKIFIEQLSDVVRLTNWLRFNGNSGRFTIILSSTLSDAAVRLHRKPAASFHENAFNWFDCHRFHSGHISFGDECNYTCRWYAKSSIDTAKASWWPWVCCSLCQSSGYLLNHVDVFSAPIIG